MPGVCANHRRPRQLTDGSALGPAGSAAASSSSCGGAGPASPPDAFLAADAGALATLGGKDSGWRAWALRRRRKRWSSRVWTVYELDACHVATQRAARRVGGGARRRRGLRGERTVSRVRAYNHSGTRVRGAARRRSRSRSRWQKAAPATHHPSAPLLLPEQAPRSSHHRPGGPLLWRPWAVFVAAPGIVWLGSKQMPAFPHAELVTRSWSGFLEASPADEAASQGGGLSANAGRRGSALSCRGWRRRVAGDGTVRRCTRGQCRWPGNGQPCRRRHCASMHG
jgi:hypothetical protein